jgi:hypothetical protein
MKPWSRTEDAMHVHEPANVTYGVMAEFDSAQAIVDAARRVVAEGYTKAEAYTPVPIEDLNTILHKRRTFLPQIALLGGITGMLTGFALQYWASVIEYPLNVGGRPYASWTAFVVPSYELTILFSALATAGGMIALNGLPQPYHPVFNAPRFSLATSDKFFLVIETADARYDRDKTPRILKEAGAKGVYDVPA